MRISEISTNLLFLFAISLNCHADNRLAGVWVLNIEDLQKNVVSTLKIHFSEDRAPSCLAGEWKKVVVHSWETSNPQSSPENKGWSYQLKGGELIIGRNEICDAFTQMAGKFEGVSVSGEYVTFGWGSRKLGYFLLERGTEQ